MLHEVVILSLNLLLLAVALFLLARRHRIHPMVLIGILMNIVSNILRIIDHKKKEKAERK